jgi:hypothetical protein
LTQLLKRFSQLLSLRPKANAAIIPKIGKIVKGAKTYAFQQFVPLDTLDKRFETLKPYAAEVIDGFAGIMKGYAENVVLRV